MTEKLLEGHKEKPTEASTGGKIITPDNNESGDGSPLETSHLIRATRGLDTSSTHSIVVERVACRVCGWRNFRFVAVNEVECNRCHEKQWYTIGPGETLTDHGIQQPVSLGLLKQLMIWLGFPQPAFFRNAPTPVQYFWFRCTSCGKVSANYPHGRSGYLPCPHCNRNISPQICENK